ncbi:MAG: FHA domain-containing protein [Nitrospirae bacterium]|nr:FHA domain-containing protein [Nitrospirota bacterium]
MKSSVLVTSFIVILTGLFIARSSVGGEVRQIKELYNKQYEYVDKQVVLEGTVDKLVDIATSEKVGNFFLRDSSGDIILIKTMEMPLSVGARVRVEGTVVMTSNDGQKTGIFIHAFKVSNLGLNSSSAKTDERPSTIPQSQNAGQTSSMLNGLLQSIHPAKNLFLILGAVIIIALIIAIAIVLTKAESRPPLALESPLLPKEDMHTIRINVNKSKGTTPAVSNETQKILPGYFEITGGLKHTLGKKIFIGNLHTKIGREEKGVDKSTGWITFPEDYTTVSRYQADLRYEEDRFIITSRSTVNPTVVNSTPLLENDAFIIKNNDRIIFGGVELTFISEVVNPIDVRGGTPHFGVNKSS